MSESQQQAGAGAPEQFGARVQQLLGTVIAEQIDAVRQVGALIARTVERGGLVHTFGTGHSHLLAEEVYSRAGGLANVNVIQSSPLMLHEDAPASGDWERLPGVAAILLEHAAIDPARDILIVISNSGRNAAPVEAAEWARAQGVPVVAVTSLAHSRSQPSLAPSGKRLCEVADVILDNLGEPGDAAIAVKSGVRVASTSTIVGAFLLHLAILSAVERCEQEDITPPIRISSNIEGARAANLRTVASYPGALSDAYERQRRALSARARLEH